MIDQPIIEQGFEILINSYAQKKNRLGKLTFRLVVSLKVGYSQKYFQFGSILKEMRTVPQLFNLNSKIKIRGIIIWLFFF